MLIIGSQAISVRDGEMYFAMRGDDENRDIDFICTKDDFKKLYYDNKEYVKGLAFKQDSGYIKTNDRIIDCQFAGTETPMQRSNQAILDLEKYKVEDGVHFADNLVSVCSIPMYALLKHSHKYKGGKHFLKTMKDIEVLNKFEKHEEFKYFIELHKDVFMQREAATYTKGYSLNKSKDEFFTDNFDYKYEHDSLHEAVKHLDVPAYKLYNKGNSEVQCDRNAFFDTSEGVRLCGVLEEVYVLALERAIIPFGVINIDREKAFETALEKVCTTITKGWFREFAYNNYNTIKRMYNPNYVERFVEAKAKGIVKPYNKPEKSTTK